MRTSILCFAAGILWLQQQALLPAGAALAALAAAGAAMLCAPLATARLRVLAPVGAFLIGIAWAGGMAHWRLDRGLDPALEGRDVRVVGVVSGLPQRFEDGWRFDFSIEEADAELPSRVSLAWYGGGQRHAGERQAGAEVHAGERWQLTVRLKRPHGNLNPEGYDFEAWLLESGIRATGTVRAGADNVRRDAFVVTPANVVAHARESIRGRFLAHLGEAPYAGVLVALAVGDQRGVEAAQWQIFGRTGITHLISISGLHVTMLASLAYLLAAALWRRSPRLMLKLPAQKAAAAFGFAAACAYCLLAGFAVPAQRTLYMLAVVTAALWRGRTTSPTRVLAIALALVLIADPWAVLAAGFWLSFLAVALLFYAATGRLVQGRSWRAWLAAQWALTLGSMPVLLLLFQQFSLVSPFANALAIPVVSFVVTPLSLAAAALPVPALLDVAHFVFALLMRAVAVLAELPWAVWQQHAPPAWASAAALAGAAWCLLPTGFPARWLGLVAMAPMVLVVPERPAPGNARVTVLDVGQGLAVHVQTAAHDLIYDTGPTYSLEANGGNRILVPYLRAKGVARLDGVIVTHEDRDHSGGAASLLEAVPAGWLMSSLGFEDELSALPVKALACQDGVSWSWDGVRFEVLHPTAARLREPTRKTNDMSCVLRVSGRGAVLLTSDIEALSETELLSRHGTRLEADVLLAPHHGSRTSLTPAFIAAVGAGAVIFPVGYRNRFRHPRPDVVARYRARGAAVYRTDADGALSFTLAAPLAIQSERVQRRRYWHGR